MSDDLDHSDLRSWPKDPYIKKEGGIRNGLLEPCVAQV